MSPGLRWAVFLRMSWAWALVERIFLRLQPLTRITPGSLFAYRVHDDVLELHLDGATLGRWRAGRGYSAFGVVRELRAELGALADRIRAGKLAEVRVIKGTSLIGEAGAVLGFRTRPLKHTVGAAFEQYFMVGLDAIHHPLGLRRRATQRWPVETTMTVEELLRRYPEKSDRSTLAR